jgi:hypothetical protein
MSTVVATLVDWAALGKGAIFAVVGAIGVVVAYSMVVVASARISTARREPGGRAQAADIALLAVGGAVCVAALVIALLAMMHKS